LCRWLRLGGAVGGGGVGAYVRLAEELGAWVYEGGWVSVGGGGGRVAFAPDAGRSDRACVCTVPPPPSIHRPAAGLFVFSALFAPSDIHVVICCEPDTPSGALHPMGGAGGGASVAEGDEGDRNTTSGSNAAITVLPPGGGMPVTAAGGRAQPPATMPRHSVSSEASGVGAGASLAARRSPNTGAAAVLPVAAGASLQLPQWSTGGGSRRHARPVGNPGTGTMPTRALLYRDTTGGGPTGEGPGTAPAGGASLPPLSQPRRRMGGSRRGTAADSLLAGVDRTRVPDAAPVRITVVLVARTDESSESQQAGGRGGGG
jgi:hypothetical protein